MGLGSLTFTSASPRDSLRMQGTLMIVDLSPSKNFIGVISDQGFEGTQPHNVWQERIAKG